MTSTTPAIEVANVRKAFGATVALDGASFSVQRGTVHALLGENGAGKSTIVKMLSGLVRPDSGDICIFGERCDIRNPRAAHQLGIQTAFQEMTQIRDLTVVQNLLLPFEPVTALGTIRQRKAEETVRDHLAAIGLGYIDPRRELRDLDLPIRQKIEIARALYRKPRILLLDEPTSSLSGHDIDWLGDLIARVKAEGVTIIFISHRMAEVRLFCDVLTVLRNGRDTGTQSVDKVSDQEVVRMIIGRSLASTFPAREDSTDRSAPPALMGTHLSAGERLLDATFSLARGEILGVAGLQGMGQAELFQASFGVVPLRSGTIEVDGRQVTLVTPRDATRASVGLGFVPEDRKTEALCLNLSGKQNITLPVIGRFTRLGFLRERAEADAVQHVLDIVGVDPRALFTRVSAFSGGNQQKIAIAKWLLAESRTLLMYDPTRGVDVGTKYELYGLMRNFTKRGGSILFYSTEIEELVNLCDRVIVMYGGRISGELAGGAITEETILRLALGVAADVPLTRVSALAATAGHRPSNLALALARHQGALTATALLIVLLIAVAAVTPGPPSYFELAFTSSGGGTIALTAIGQTLVVLSGGFDLSCGMTVSLVNVVLATYMQELLGSEITYGLAALAIGAAVGVFNGFFVAFFRLQPIVVTLASMFLIHGITLMVASEAGGAIPPPFIKFLTGDLIPGVIPAALVVVAIAIAIWLVIKRTRFGTAIYAVGSDALSAQAAGISVKWTKFFTYVVAGTFYGAAGAFISAQAGAGDPLVGTPLLLESFTAVVLGGTVFGGGRGGCVGTVVGAYVLLLLVNVLIVLQVSSFYSSLVEGVVLLVAVLAYSLNRRSELYVSLSKLVMRFGAWRAGTLASQRAMVGKALRAVSFDPRNRTVVVGAHRRGSWLQRHGEVLRFVLPAWFCFVLVVIATGIVYGPRMVATVHYFDTVIEIAALLSILALGQGTVIMAGGFDLSIPWALTLCGIVASELIFGSDLHMLWAIPIVLGIGAFIGLANGFGVVFLGMPPIVITLATNGILQGVSLVHTEGHTKGYASTSLHWLMTGKVWGVTPVVAFVACFAAFSVVLLARTGFGRRVLAVGNSTRVATLSGIGVGGTIVATYVLSGICSALAGVLSVGLIGRASLDMGQDFLLPSIAVVVVGGTLITGGRGHYLGMLGGALLLTALQIIFSGTSLPPSTRDVIFGLVMLGSVLALRDR